MRIAAETVAAILIWIGSAIVIHMVLTAGATNNVSLDLMWREFIASAIGAFFALGYAGKKAPLVAKYFHIGILSISGVFFISIPILGMLYVEFFSAPYTYELVNQLRTICFGAGAIVSTLLINRR